MKQINQIRTLFAVLGIIGVALIAFSTSRYGACMTTISGDIISAAKNLLAFEGYLQHDGRPYVEYPPLLPSMVALISVAGIDPAESIRWLNAVCFGLIVFLSGLWLHKKITFQPLAILGTVSFVLSFPLISVSICAWTETVFALFIILFLFEFGKYLETGKMSSYYLAIVYAALSCLARYLGVWAILTGAILLFLRNEDDLPRRLRRAVVFGFLAILPTLVWITRNYVLTSQFSGDRGVSSDPFGQNLYIMTKILSSWFIPPRVPEVPRIVIAVLVFAGVCVWLVRIAVLSRKDSTKAAKMRQVLPAAFFTFGYVIIMVILASVVALDGLNARFFTPIYVPAFLLLFVTVDDLRGRWARVLPGKTLNYIIIGVFLIWLVPPLRGVARNVRVFADVGAGGYSSTQWVNSELIRYLKTNSLDGEIYSNEPYAVNILTGIPAKLSPRRHLFRAPETLTNDLEEFEDAVKSGGDFYLVWFDEVKRPYLYSVDQLRETFTLEVVDSLPDGSVYLLE